MITAIDLGYSTVKILQLTGGTSGYTILNSGSKAVSDNLKSYDPEKITKANWVAAIQDLSKEMGINPKKIKNLVTSISGHGVSVKQISTMEMSEDEMINSLEFEARKHIPLDGSEPVIDFHMLGQDKKEIDKSNVLLVSTTKNIVMNHYDIIKNAGFKPGVFDTDTVALTNCYIHNSGFSNSGIGDTSSVFSTFVLFSSELILNTTLLSFFLFSLAVTCIPESEFQVLVDILVHRHLLAIYHLYQVIHYTNRNIILQ